MLAVAILGEGDAEVITSSTGPVCPLHGERIAVRNNEQEMAILLCMGRTRETFYFEQIVFV